MRLPARLVPALLACLVSAVPALATTADDLPCAAPAPAPCELSSKQITVDHMSVLDLTGRDLVLKSGSALTVGTAPMNAPGTMTIKAANVVLEGGTALKGSGSTIIVDVTGNISVLKSTNPARIDVAGVLPGEISLEADGNLLVQGILDAGAAAIDAYGGGIDVVAMDVSIPGLVNIHGGKNGIGGSILIDAKGFINLAGIIDATGGDGGSVQLLAEGEIVSTGKFDQKATLAGGEGGELQIETFGGGVELGGTVDLKGEGGSEGGDGGALDVFSAGSIEVTGDIDLRGATPGGAGGAISLNADLDVIQSSTIMLQTAGQEGLGGEVEFTAERRIEMADIIATGGFIGGSIVATAWCDLEVANGVDLDAGGSSGTILLQSGGTMTIAGHVSSGAVFGGVSDGSNRVVYLEDLPTLAGAVFAPAAAVTSDENLIPCGGPVTPGCGNSMTEPGLDETCDDGNSDSCDGCSSSCRTEVCGNGTRDCGEECDDNNTVSGDGCLADCSRLDNVCGDGIPEGTEECDDGDGDDCNACSNTCTTKTCGNGRLDCGEECDDGLPGGTCDDTCQVIPPPNCGDGATNQGEGEACDDGNTADCDGCSHLCQPEGCGNGRVECLETCDDFNTGSCDGCSPTCATEECGNDVLDCFETCDDAGTPGSLCLPGICEVGEFCTSETPPEQPCIACANDLDCDPMGACGPSQCETDPNDARKECTPTDPPSCDDGNACTEDACDAATGCVTTPRICDDGQACNGAETCDPTTGCVSVALVCDDGDVCSDDTCDDGSGCSSTLRTGLALVTCRVAEIESIINGPDGGGIATPARKKLGKGIKGIKAKLTAASSPKAKKAGRAKKAASKQIAKLGTLVTKVGAQIPAPIASELSRAIGSASQAIATVP